jgi:cell volume regulation protein A
VALLLGALVAPTDAAAVTSVLRASKVSVPHRVLSVLELESGLNDPMSVFLTVLLTEIIAHPDQGSVAHAALMLAREMGGGAAIGLAGGWAMVLIVRHLKLESSLYPALLLACALAVFGAGQLFECSGFLAVYLAGLLVGNYGGARAAAVEQGFEAFTWIAQVGLFLALGLLVNPRDIVPFAVPALGVAVVLIFCARPLAALMCVRPFGIGWRDTGFIAWVGLRGAVPIYLAMIPVLERLPRGDEAFSLVFVIVLVSLVVQGWTVGPVARLLGFSSVAATPPAVPVP